jgi:hypothetical protein
MHRLDLQDRPDHDRASGTFDGNDIHHHQHQAPAAQPGLNISQINISAPNISEPVQSNSVQPGDLVIYGHAQTDHDQASRAQAVCNQPEGFQVSNVNDNDNDMDADSLQVKTKAKKGQSQRTILKKTWQRVMFVYKLVQREKQVSWFDVLPADVRQQILGYLLISPEVGDVEAVRSGMPSSFGLHPAILRTCKRLNVEASKILYEANTFAISCLPSNFTAVSLFSSALTRYNHVHRDFEDNSNDRATQLPYGAEHILVNQILGFSRVRSWHVLATPCYELDDCDDQGLLKGSRNLELLLFCRAACQNVVKAINVHPVCRHSTCGQPDIRAPRGHRTMPLAELFKPILLFRGLEELTMERSHRQCRVPPGESILSVIQSEVKGCSPADRLFLMYHLLLLYAQSFERCATFKAHMGRSEQSSSQKIQNPFLSTPFHPVEGSLIVAKIAMNTGRRQLFIAARILIMNFLRMEYRRIATARHQVVRDNIASEPVFDSTPQATHRMPQGMNWPAVPRQLALNPKPAPFLRIQQYQRSFGRYVEQGIKDAIAQIGTTRFIRIYEIMDRGMVMKQLEWALQDQEFEQAEGYYRRALVDMDAQLTEIQEARDNVYDHDTSGHNPLPPTVIL